ncbi:hypothetical protein KPY62_13490, partial [Psychrobacter sp. TAE2020]|uniref:Ig-like domain-containing protein n=1 Tax=Psychrobacter sp. TAE2020 TaxID=2846762 RepID=UPI001E63A954
MSTITVKVNNQTKTIAEHTVVTKDGVPTIIKAINKVNYELFDQSIGRAPNHIITKRVNNDLHISFEEEGIESDLIIEGFYSETDSALIGIAEDGSYYYYIPDTGEVADYVTELLAGDVEGQALGGNSQVLPWWVGASSEGFNALPWLVGLAGIGLIGAVSGGSNDKQDAPKPDTTAPTAPTLDINAAGTEITGKTEPGAKVEIDTDGDGKPDYTVTADANGNFVVDTSEKPLTNGETITATATDKAGNESGPTTIVAGDTTAPTAPDKVVVGNGDAFITADEIDKDGNVDVVVTLPTDAKEGDVVVVNGQEHPITKGDITAGTVTVKVPAPTEGGKLDVEATIKDPAGNVSAPVTEEAVRDTTAPIAPSINDNEAGQPITGTGEPGATVTVTYPDGTTVDAIVGVDGSWTAPTNPSVVDGTQVTATQTDTAGNISPQGSANVADTTAPVAPSINDNEAGQPITGTGEPGATVTVTYPDGTTVDAIVGVDGSWTAPTNPSVVDGTQVTATQTDTAGNTSPQGSANVADTTAPVAPSINDNEAGQPIT